MTAEVGPYAQALVYTNVNDVIFHLRVEGDRYRFLHINPAFTRATGLPPEAVLGKFVDEVIPEPSLTLVRARYREAIAERRTVRWEEVTDYPTGRKIGEVSVTPVFENGACTQLVGTVSDVTQVRSQRAEIELYAEIVRSLQLGLAVCTVDDPDDLATIKLAGFNASASHMLAGVEMSVGQPILEMLPALRETELPETIANVARDRTPRELPEIRSVLDPTRMLSVKVFPLSGKYVSVALDDITSAYRAAHARACERRALEQLANNEPLGEILTTIVHMIETLEPPTIASILLLDETGTRLRHGAAPGLPDAYNRAIDGAPISAKAGSCGTAAFRGVPVYVEDINVDPLWEDYRELAQMLGTRACWSTPILSNDRRVLGTFALYDRAAKLPARHQIEVIGRATHIAAIVIQRRRLDEQLRALTEHIEAVREDERTGIAREIHDELGQALTAFKLDIGWIGRRVPENGEISTKLTEMTAMTDAVIQSVRRISAELRPGILDDVGLAAAIEWQAANFQERTGIATVVTCDLGQAKVERGLATTVFRIYQEALTNIARHAAATHVEVLLHVEGECLQLEVNDDGIGVSEPGTANGLGLLGMQERARRVGGTCTVSRREPRGTNVLLRLPLAQRA